MKTTRRARLAAGVTAAAAGLALVPATASAVSLTITDDGGNPVPFAGEPALRNMSPSIGFVLAPGENVNYTATFAGPDGAGTASPINCFGIPSKRLQDYRGNGVYTVTLQHYDAKDYSCKTPVGAPQVFRYSINGSVALTGQPAGRVLFRQRDSFTPVPIVLGFGGNPGALGNEIRYAANTPVGPDGGIAGLSQETTVDSATGTVPLRLTAPGRYVVVARAKGFATATGQFFTPWSPPVTVDAVAPFDIETFRTLDSRGPSYRIRIQLREHSASGRVSIHYARGTKRGRYRSLGSVKIKSGGVFTKRFTLRRSGTYRMRFTYRGGPTVGAGQVVAGFRVSRRFAF